MGLINVPAKCFDRVDSNNFANAIHFHKLVNGHLSNSEMLGLVVFRVPCYFVRSVSTFYASKAITNIMQFKKHCYRSFEVNKCV